ncbi:hypothetical protein CEXT_290501 [Caerostris extrusa]|uniref:Uncharacterized protein n=1 Tax=Caerostris extrusa TaxID=172846 RepID=A0AAV4UT94_CAEEX|nr:hypothetical protein CEXT_290501 [Caerostris extrusa]
MYRGIQYSTSSKNYTAITYMYKRNQCRNRDERRKKLKIDTYFPSRPPMQLRSLKIFDPNVFGLTNFFPPIAFHISQRYASRKIDISLLSQDLHRLFVILSRKEIHLIKFLFM